LNIQKDARHKKARESILTGKQMKSLSCIFLIVLLVGGFVLVCNLNSGAAQDYTEVGGILYSDTTWTIENSPYSVTSMVQIPENVTLKIDPGVTVIDNSADYIMFLLHGKIEAHGTPTNKIAFIGRGDWVVFFNTGGAVSGPSISLDYCIIKHGMTLLQDTCGYVNVTNSEIVDVGRSGGTPSYIRNSEGDFYIEHNMFIDTNGFDISDTNEHVYIRYNLFKGNRGFLVKEWVHTGFSPKAVVKYNTFIGVSETVLMIFSWDAQGSMDATENYWGTSNTSLVESWIEDGHSDIGIHAFIDYLPILTEPHPDTPTLPITASFETSPDAVYAYGETNFDATASFAEYSQIASYTWDFGDGTITTTSSPTIKYTYTTPSSYDVSLTVTDEFGFTNSTSATIEVLLDDVSPVTSDDYDGLWHNEDFTITLAATDAETGVAETYYRINDGATKTVSANGQPLINTEGANNTLEYWSVDNTGNEEQPTTVTAIKLDTTKPTADAGQDQTVKVDTTVTFNANASSDNLGIVSYEWDFGNGATGTSETTTYTYTNTGTYTVTLTVKDAAGNADTRQITVTVKPPEEVLPWIIVVVAAAAITVAATALFWKKRKKHS
jgi:PKD repeat protein